MLSLVLHALRARRGQSVAMFALALLAALGSAAAPWYLAWADDAVARAAVADAPVRERLVFGGGSLRYEPAAGNPLELLRERFTASLPVPGSRTEVGARAFIAMTLAGDDGRQAGRSVDHYLVTRDGVCDQVRMVAGRCPRRPGEVVVSQGAALALGVGVGDQVQVTGLRLRSPAGLTVVGVYVVADPYGEYWVGTELLPAVQLGRGAMPDPALVSEETFIGLPLDAMELQARMVLPVEAFTDPAAGLKARLADAVARLNREGLGVETFADRLAERIAHDRSLVVLGVGLGAAQLVIICWVGLFLAVRQTSEERRADIALLKLRGATTRRVWTFAALFSGVPMLAGTVLAAVVGFGAAAALAASVGDVAGTRSGLFDVARTATGTDAVLSLAAAAVAGLGGLVVAVAAQRHAIRAPVAELLRRVPPRRRGWRADVADLVVVAIAAAGVYQGHVEAGRASVLALLAPALVGLAVALLAARALPPVAARMGASALRAGRAGAALAALALARRQGMHRTFAVLAVAAAVFTTSTMLWHAAGAAWQQRAVMELGADRVLAVDAPNAAALLQAVRAVDPDGRYAMAVASTPGGRTPSRVIAVDSARLAQVGRMVDGGPTAADVASLLRPPAPLPPTVPDGPVTVDASASAGGTGLRLLLSTVDGATTAVDLTVPEDRSPVQATVSGCDPRCRLVALEVLAPRTRPVTVEIFALDGPGGAILSPRALADIAQWRTTTAPRTVPPVIAAGPEALSVTVPAGPLPDGWVADTRVLPLTTPTPLPVFLAGPAIPPSGGDARVAPLGGTDVPFRVVGNLPALPTLGERGVLVDLEYALRGNDDGGERADLAVWVTADAPAGLVEALGEHGVTVVSETSVAARTSGFAGHGPGLALRFGYFVVVVVLLLAAGVAVVDSTVDRAGRAGELMALRGQGLDARAARTAAYAGTAVLALAATVTGVVAALLASVLVTARLPVFSDDWRLLPVPDGLTLVTISLAAGITLTAFGAASLWGSARLVAAVRRGRFAGGPAVTRGGDPR